MLRRCAALLAALAVGCGGGDKYAPPAPPSYNPSAAVDAALAAFDRNKDRDLDPGELAACPPLKAAAPHVDKNRDGKLSADELKARFEQYQATGLGATAIVCRVSTPAGPLAGATVTFVPEPFLGGVVTEVTGQTGADGSVSGLTAAGKPVPGLACGLYRVKVSKADAGTETVPAKYNAQTTLGVEVFPGGRGTGDTSYEFKLTGF